MSQEPWQVIFDLDNTLVCAMSMWFDGADPHFAIRQNDWMEFSHLDPIPKRREDYYVYERPGLRDSLQALVADERCQLHVWTAGSCAYAYTILKRAGVLDAFDSIIGSEFCTKLWFDEHGMAHTQPDIGRKLRFAKDLSRLAERGFNLNKTIMIDNSRMTVVGDMNNLLVIPTYSGDPEDTCLPDLARLFTEVDGVLSGEDVYDCEWSELRMQLDWDVIDPDAWYRSRGLKLVWR